LSGQKIWAKKLELEAQSMPYVVKTTIKFGFFLQDVTTDNRADVAAKLLSQFYQGLMEKIWQHADPRRICDAYPPNS